MRIGSASASGCKHVFWCSSWHPPLHSDPQDRTRERTLCIARYRVVRWTPTRSATSAMTASASIYRQTTSIQAPESARRHFCLQAMDAADASDVYDLIVERHRRGSIVVTTNRQPPAEWLAAMGDPLLAQSAIDRLLSNSYELVVEGPSYRGRQRPGWQGGEGTASVNARCHMRPPGVKSAPRPSDRPAAGC